MEYLIDANIFLRVLIKENKKTFEECYRFLEKVKRGERKAATASLVLAEIAWTLTSYYRFSPKKVAQAIRGVVNLHRLRIIDGYNHFLAIELFEDKRVKYIDALIASVSQIQQKKWAIVSYDKDFDKLGVKRIEPGKV